MAHTTVNPDGLHDPVPFGYSHTVRVPATSELVLVAGQYGSDESGAVVDSAFEAQVERTLHNLGLALSAHGLALSDVVQLRTYVVGLSPDKLPVIAAAVGSRWGDTPPAQTLVGVAALATPDLSFEVEAVAATS